jgi:RNA polymerase sigma-70 factor (ECF subfamily)
MSNRRIEVTAEAQTTAGIAGDNVLDAESRAWLRDLGHANSSERYTAQARLHEMLLRIARREVRRRSASLRISGPELDDLAYQAAADAMMAITSKLSTFRGESRFTTWAYKFVILEVSAKMGRHFWRERGVSFDAEDWDRLPDQFGLHPAHEAEGRDLAAALRSVAEEELTERQRRVFVALVLNDVPLDALIVELNTNRNAIYKMMFDTRRKLRAALVAKGYLDSNDVRHAHE